MKEYYNHVALWVKANKPKYIIVRVTYKPGDYEWLLEPINIFEDGSVMIDCFDFEDYVTELFKGDRLKFYKFDPKSFDKEEI